MRLQKLSTVRESERDLYKPIFLNINISKLILIYINIMLEPILYYANLQ